MTLRYDTQEGLSIRANDKQTRINQQIRVPEVRLIDQDGNQVGVVRTSEALANAREVGMDLVEISPNAKPPVCRIMDYGKYQFELKKKKSAQKKKAKKIQVKGINFRPSTDVGDFDVKCRKITEFLDDGDKVKVSVRFRGREMQHKDLGLDLLDRVKTRLPAGAVVEQEPRLEGRQMTMVVGMGRQNDRVADSESE